MHECTECVQAGDIDLEDMWNEPPDDCDCRCDDLDTEECPACGAGGGCDCWDDVTETWGHEDDE